MKTTDTAEWVAAATLAVHAMTEAIHKANQLTIAGGKPWTKKQQAAIAQANSILEAAGIWSGRGWTTAQAYDVAQAGVDAQVSQYKRKGPNAMLSRKTCGITSPGTQSKQASTLTSKALTAIIKIAAKDAT